jgi:ABC-2 type transport system ATP-binding protein
MIEFSQITKRFGTSEVLRGIDLRVERGRIMGLVGPNGAGKTTLIKTLLRLAHPTAGDIRVNGVSIAGDESYRAGIGYMPQIARFPDNLSATELFAMLRDLRGSNAETDHELIERFGLADHLDKPLRVLSGGTRQKVNACMAFLFRPSVLVLDEPTSGLDPIMESVFTEYVEQFRAGGGTVLLSSHILAEVERLCDRVSIIRSGRRVETGTLADLRHLTRTSVVAELARPVTGLAELPGVHDLDVQGERAIFEVDTVRIDEAVGLLHRAGIRSLTATPPTLEELFLRHYGDEIPAADPEREADGS